MSKRKAKAFLIPAITAPVPPPTPEELAESKKRTLEHTRQRIIEQAQDAIRCMSDFLRNAQRRIDDVVADPDAVDFMNEPRFLRLPEHMIHEFGWGMSNASSRIQSCAAAVVDYMRLERLP